MPTTRSSKRATEHTSSDAEKVTEPQAGSKRKDQPTASQEDPDAKKSKTESKQLSIEESLAGESTKEDNPPQPVQDEAPQGTGGEANGDDADAKEALPKEEEPTAEEDENADEKPVTDTNPSDDKMDLDDQAGAIEHSKERGESVPSSILEKGIIYFFTRARVNIDEPESADDLARTYFVLRPLPKDSKVGQGALEDSKNNRLFALPKKVFPRSKQDRFMAFVEKANVSIEELKENFLQGSDYSTKTAGDRHTPAVTPIGEGVYALTSNERATHLAYMLTIPSDVGEVQEEMGLHSKGSFLVSVKNPQRPGPASTRLPEGPKFPEEIINEFRGLAWSEVKPNYLDYDNVQILLIGEGTHDDFGSALEPSRKDEKHGKALPEEELEKLEDEDQLRVQHLSGDDSVFDDLKLSKDEYAQVKTTW